MGEKKNFLVDFPPWFPVSFYTNYFFILKFCDGYEKAIELFGMITAIIIPICWDCCYGFFFTNY